MNRRSPAIELQLPPGMRATRATRAMVALLRGRSADRFTAAETEAALARKGVAVNRVTVFRALDRLTQAGLLQRRVDSDRITRYQWRGEAPAPAARLAAWQARFTCMRCHAACAVDATPAMDQALQSLKEALQQAGAGQALCTQAVHVQGLCAQCLPDAPRTEQP